MQIFLDTANLDEIRKGVEWGIVDGVTTNPTLLAREIKRTSRKKEDILYEICELVNGPVSAEGVSLDFDGMVRDAKYLSSIHPNIIVKIPVTTTGVRAIRKLHELNIKVNATLVFSPNQAILAAKAGANFVSPFIGRLDDIGDAGMRIVEQIVTIFENYRFTSKVIVASVRHPMHVVEAALIGADIVTMPFNVLEKMFRHQLTDVGIERFIKDWEEAARILGE